MIKDFDLIIHDNHLFFEEHDEIFMIDTGSPVSINSKGSVNLLDFNFSTETNYINLAVDDIAKSINFPFTTLLGNDIISKYKMLISTKSKKITFSNNSLPFAGRLIEMQKRINIPVIDINILGNPHKMFLDSGSKLSYLNSEFTKNNVSMGKIIDYYPLKGKFETSVYHLKSSVADIEFFANYGNLTELLQISLKITDAEGILGFDFFKSFDLLFDFENELLQIA